MFRFIISVLKLLRKNVKFCNKSLFSFTERSLFNASVYWFCSLPNTGFSSSTTPGRVSREFWECVCIDFRSNHKGINFNWNAPHFSGLKLTFHLWWECEPGDKSSISDEKVILSSPRRTTFEDYEENVLGWPETLMKSHRAAIYFYATHYGSRRIREAFKSRQNEILNLRCSINLSAEKQFCWEV